MAEKINLDAKFGLFTEPWRPKVIASLNGQEVKVVKVLGTFPWHRHASDDEFFIVWSGRMFVDFPDRSVLLGPGECLVVPHGVEHRTRASEEACVLCFEPAGVVNTGDSNEGEFTAPNSVRI